MIVSKCELIVRVTDSQSRDNGSGYTTLIPDFKIQFVEKDELDMSQKPVTWCTS